MSDYDELHAVHEAREEIRRFAMAQSTAGNELVAAMELLLPRITTAETREAMLDAAASVGFTSSDLRERLRQADADAGDSE